MVQVLRAGGVVVGSCGAGGKGIHRCWAKHGHPATGPLTLQMELLWCCCLNNLSDAFVKVYFVYVLDINKFRA